MKTEISNELILQAHKEACSKWKSLIEKECPELFKPKFKVGDWVQFCCDSWIKRVDQLIPKVRFSDGSHAEEGWMERNPTDYRLATPTEIESHLIQLAKEKGFKEGVAFYGVGGCQKDEKIVIGKNRPMCFTNDKNPELIGLYCENSWIYKGGKWATIIEEPKVIELTMEDIAKLKGVDVSQIKIVK